MIYAISRGDELLQIDSQYRYVSLMETTLLYPTGDHPRMMTSTRIIRVNPRVLLYPELGSIYPRVRGPDNIHTENILGMTDSRI
jgi:hypothetical protein